jgi:phosphoribosylformylglycinamidine cyclo-ligase
MALVVAPGDVESVMQDLAAAGETAYNIGKIATGTRGCTVIGTAEAWSGREPWSATHNA